MKATIFCRQCGVKIVDTKKFAVKIHIKHEDFVHPPKETTCYICLACDFANETRGLSEKGFFKKWGRSRYEYLSSFRAKLLHMYEMIEAPREQ